MKKVVNNIIEPIWPAPNHIIAGVTTRIGGNSKAPFSAWNLAEHVGDNNSHVAENRALLNRNVQALARGQNIHSYWLDQVHGTEAVEIDGSQPPTPQADAAVTSLPNIICCVLTADCLPILLCDKQGKRVAAIHAGWRGLAQGVIENTVEQFCGQRQSAKELIAWLGPAIGPDHFEVGAEVKEQFTQPNHSRSSSNSLSSNDSKDDTDLYETAFTASPNRGEPERYLADLYQLATIKLNRAGVHGIYGGGFCTICEQDRFFSYRGAQHHCNALSDSSARQQSNAGKHSNAQKDSKAQESSSTGRMASFILIAST